MLAKPVALGIKHFKQLRRCGIATINEKTKTHTQTKSLDEKKNDMEQLRNNFHIIHAAETNRTNIEQCHRALVITKIEN